mgnify:CR=1 FL=1
MNFEIEKKFLVNDFNLVMDLLKKDFGDYQLRKKAGFWFATNFDRMELFLDMDKPLFSKKDVTTIKDIAELAVPEMDFEYCRIRIVNSESYIITFKIKNLVNNIEQNTEYEFEIDKETAQRIHNILKSKSHIFFYNIKESYEFKKENLKIELSRLTDLTDSYLEVELTGDNEKDLTKKLEFELEKFKLYSIVEEPRSYTRLTKIENRNKFKNLKLSNYSKEATKSLESLLQ